jgi:hypothetical protein
MLPAVHDPVADRLDRGAANSLERLELFDMLVVGDEVELQAGRACVDDEN